jgi:hypothetical protein
MPGLTHEETQARDIAYDESLTPDERLAKLKALKQDFGYSEMVVMEKAAKEGDPEWAR